ncbi:alpha amylase, catalytic domain protein [Leptotrichia sp. oral taxon 215 str. W9775]|uniref:glycoside hydrolase family 13 protein n=1 Tax=Leptotrichia sp. oral taxon 215 TaxID=712359 RepID=UPI0003AE4B38|nr:alpha-glucosidase [Leptotrichia sp. oral taxon 215]ERK69004.1 alpha amylase, catalytic domain protein [Leptotrichia sp. oral taxon 215 str. W9775]
MDTKKLDKKWWQKEVGYQIYPRSFYDSNNDGIGDLNGITAKLDYLKELGITLIWVCPIFKSPMDDNGYDISDYYDVNPEFGTKEDLEKLIAEAEKRGIKVILDLVINHTSDEHEWFLEALKNPESKYRNYYIFKRGKNGLPPTNWRSHFGGSAWEKVEGEADENGNEMYYLHLFTKKQPDLNWENPEVRKELYKMVNYWLEKGIAGFRVDAINSIKKDARYLDLPVDGADGRAYNVEYTLNQPGIEEFLSELAKETFKKYNAMTVAETPMLEYERYNDFIGDDGFFTMIFDFSYTDLDMTKGGFYYSLRDIPTIELRDAIFESQLTQQKYGWGAPFFENHDLPRSLNKFFGEKANETNAKLLANVFFFLRGTPFIYQGQEIGMDNFVRNDISEFDDIASKDQYQRALGEGFSSEEALYFVNKRSRDNSRTPMQWDNSKNAGFLKDENSKSWIKLTGSQATTNVADQINDKDSIFSHYKKMIDLRQNGKYSDCLIYGDFIPVPLENEKIIAYVRKYENQKLLCISNFSELKQEVELNDIAKVLGEKEIILGKILINNFDKIGKDEKKLNLEGFQSLLVEI